MAKNYASSVSNKRRGVVSTPQTKKAKKGQVKNSAGGYSFKVTPWTKLQRFLILGTEGGSYYASSQKMTKNNAKTIQKLLKEDGKRVVDTVVDVSDKGRAYKNDPALFVLALAASAEDADVRSYALANLAKVARTGTHLFTFVAYADSLRGWGRGFQKAVARWYNDKRANKLAYQVCKYQSRRLEGELPWSHRDLLRKTHLRAATADHNLVYKYVTKGRDAFTKSEWADVKKNKDLTYIWAHEEIKKVDTASEAAKLIKKYNLSHESVPTEVKKSKVVYDALLEGMPLNAMLRQLGLLTSVGTVAPLSKGAKLVVEKLEDVEAMKRQRVHPFAILVALKMYKQGRGHRGSNTWTPVPAVLDALNDAYYKAFEAVEPTGQNYLLGVDVSGSMGGYTVNGVDCMTAREGAAAMAMTIARTEKNYHIMGFSRNFVDLKIKANDSLEQVMRKTSGLPFSGTDCALPMKWALMNRADVDVFVVITDNETWAGSQHPHEALVEYRKKMNKPNAKLVVIGMAANDFSIADPSDRFMLDISGFDTSCPSIISNFALGKI